MFGCSVWWALHEMHLGKFIEGVQFSYGMLWKQIPCANNRIFREMILLFVGKECFELLYGNFSVRNIPDVVLWIVGFNGLQEVGIVVCKKPRKYQEVIVKIWGWGQISLLVKDFGDTCLPKYSWTWSLFLVFFLKEDLDIWYLILKFALPCYTCLTNSKTQIWVFLGGGWLLEHLQKR